MANKKQREAIEFRITNANGIQDATIRIERGVVTELHGLNGAHKTSAMDALRRYCGDDSAHVELHDGAELGSVEGPGPALMITEAKVRMRGKSAIEPADRGGALIRLITGGGLKGDKERNAARIRALAELVEVRADHEVIEILCGAGEDASGEEVVADQQLLAWMGQVTRAGAAEDLFSAAAMLKPQIDEFARTAESAAEQAAGRAEGAKTAVQGILARLKEAALDPLGDDDVCDTESARSAAVNAKMDLERKSASAANRASHQAHILEIRRTLGERPNLELADEAAMAAFDAQEKAENAVRVLDDQLQQARQKLAAAAEAYNAALKQRDQTASQAKAWDANRQLVDRPAQGATEEEVLRAELAVTDAQAEEDRHRLTTELRKERAAQRAAREEEDRQAARAAVLRKLGKGLADRVGVALGRKGVSGITVVDGRLAWTDPATGEPVDWDRRMSSGQRFRAAFALAAKKLDGIVFLPSNEEHAFYLLLDPKGKKELQAIVAEMDLYCVTEVPDDCTLKVIYAGGEEPS